MHDINEILNKDKITIVITDSGLGGISVCAGIEAKLKANKSFDEVNLIFFNALPEKGNGYNSMPNIEIKAGVFNEALLSMEEKNSPDMILIACNTLSVVYPYTNFAKHSSTHVLGIVEFGVQMIQAELEKHGKADVMILGTQTTIKSETHKNKLISEGISKQKIICQTFPNLESEIQDSPDSTSVSSLVKLYLKEAFYKLDNTDNPIIAALCCTHYGFSKSIFNSTFKELTNRQVIILNPNELMINSVEVPENRDRYSETKINVRVVSRAIIDEDERDSIGSLIKPYAPLSSTALMNYEFNPNLFDFTRI